MIDSGCLGPDYLFSCDWPKKSAPLNNLNSGSQGQAMNHNRSLLLILVFLPLFFAAALAEIAEEDKFSYDGQIRIRQEYDLKSFDSDRIYEEYTKARIRLGFRFQPSDMTWAYIQLQTSKRWGDPYGTDEVELHQGYFVLTYNLTEELETIFKVGRYEMIYGDQRVFSSSNWSDEGRVWDGATLTIKSRRFSFDFFGSKIYENFSRNIHGISSRDFFVIGFYGTYIPAELDIFFFHEHDKDTHFPESKRLFRYNIGGYWFREQGDFDFTIQGNYQFGDIPDYSLLMDISAYMINSEIGYTFDDKTAPRIAAGIDYTTGDDISRGDKYTVYNNSYTTSHKFRGYMDYFSGSPTYGLMDLYFSGKIKPTPIIDVKTDFHYFHAAEYYISYYDHETKTKNLGYEIDITANFTGIEAATLTGGLSYFIPDDHFATDGPDKKNGFWAYLQGTVDF